MKFILPAMLLVLAAILTSQPAPREQPGPLPDGGFLLNSGWKIKPAGRQVPLDTFPMSTALSPDGAFLLVLNGGYKPPSISVLDAASMKEIGRTPVPDGWLGLAFEPKGKQVYVGGGSRASVFEYSISPEGRLEPARTFPIVPEKDRSHRDFIGDVALSPDGRLIYAAGLYQDTIFVINPQSGMVIERFKTGRRPYRILFHPDGKSFFVSSWVDGTLLHHNAQSGEILARVRLGPHPTDIVWSSRKAPVEEGQAAPAWTARMFVAAANTNRVYVVDINESRNLRVIESINVAMTPNQPLGMTPSALALNADESRLYVVCSDANAVAVADVTGQRSRVLGFVPTGWYPTAARAMKDGTLVILNGRGLRSYPNPRGPNPAQRPEPVHKGTAAPEYVGRLQTGSASIVPPFNDERLEEYTATVLANSPYEDVKLIGVNVPADSPIPPSPGAPSLIQHVIYIVKENRTYDQVLGGLEKGNGDPSLVLFDEKASPNHHKLARDFVLFDNFYVNSDVSADGHNWSTAAIAPDYVQKLWPNSYGGRRRHYDYEGTEPAATPPAGYLWTNAAAAGVSMRNYGYFVNNLPKPGPDGIQVGSVRDPVLDKVTNRKYRGFDMDYPDIERAKVLLEDLAQFEQSGEMPRLLLVRLGNDHTSGTAPGKIAPLSAMADNDYALGMIVEAVSKSRFWPTTAIFVLEDDAQNGPDHVDSHRSVAFVLSPYARRGAVDSTMYNTTSVLRTMELILGLRPMTHFDAGARVMTACFQAKPNLKPYTAEKPRMPLDDRNPASSPTAARSARLDLSEADRIDDDELNDILWRAIRGTEPPAPVRSFFAR
ncbi:MAG TPA: bifunctional YncE family protein/alkaline phosphatase family protein [Bryobacteraceae bacterium]|nr:bifunctional YncE family protein/alkaline phosphatase family protein [Bryobacteraceae bacterium]